MELHALFHRINTSNWATQLEKVFRDEAEPESLWEFEYLYRFQRLFTYTNLTIMQDVALGRYQDAYRGFLALCGLTFSWAERYGYFRYMMLAYDWAVRHYLLPAPLAPPWRAVEEFYLPLVSQPGVLPMPEVSEGVAPTPPYPGGVVYRDGENMMWRTRGAAGARYLLIGTSTDLSHAANFHFRPMGFAYWKELAPGVSRWLARCPAYTGYNAADVLKDEADRGNTVPRGIFGPTWRLAPPVLTLHECSLTKVVMEYTRPRAWWGLLPGKNVLREYRVGFEVLEVRDNGTTIFKG